GGAAYLFDLIPGVYEGMKKTDPRTIKIRVSIAILRISPTPSSEKVSSLYRGESATGLEKEKDWMKVKTSSGQTGWIMRSQTQ
ncbi:SH3 domain-containing protein, partial [bacterium]|nr:SH3 domain-containing protein [bacterium]